MASASHLLFASHLVDPKSQDASYGSAASRFLLNPAIARQPTGKFPKSARLLKSAHFRYLHKNSLRHVGEVLCIDFRQGRTPAPKLGITVSRKYGKAHIRNRFKRVVREAFRHLYQFLPPDLELHVSPRKTDTVLTTQAVLLELQSLLSRIIPR